MSLGNPRLWIAILSVAAILCFVFEDLGRTSPGELTTVHGRESALTGFRSCAQCHGGWTGTMTESCLACHEPIATHIETGAGLHGSLGAERVAQCGACHSEHHGTAFQLVNRQSFAKAGIADPGEFDHGLVGFDMAGRHLELDCTKCHEQAEARVLAAGTHRYLGLQQDCASCHQDPHEGRMVLACAQCHGQESFSELTAVGHDAHLPLDGGHAALSCTDCHDADGRHSLHVLGAATRSPRRTCVDCHETPHDTGFVATIAKLAGEPPTGGCVVCHAPRHGSFVAPQVTVTTEQHASSGFRLDLPHDAAACADCHGSADRPYAERYPGRGPDDCRTCHDDPHGGQFADSPLAAQGCVACHSREHFAPHAFTSQMHARTDLALTGAHLDADCTRCHTEPDGGGPRTFRGTPSRCEQCHEDAHDGFFDVAALAAPPGGENPTSQGTCAHCHQPTSFGADRTASSFDHARWTGFPIAGAHAQSDCESCHPRGAEPDRFGRTFGRVREHVSVAPDARVTCAVCHGDPHRGAFDGAELPREVDGRAGCARCHTETSFRALRDDFDHGTWTGFALRGVHAEQNCSACHAQVAATAASERAWGRARGRACADCHDDPHGGQFDRAGRADCRRCHRDGNDFADLAFNHELHSRFSLGPAHSPLACSACHKPRSGDGIVRYKPIDPRCSTCHGQHRDPLRRRSGRRR